LIYCNFKNRPFNAAPVYSNLELLLPRGGWGLRVDMRGSLRERANNEIKATAGATPQYHHCDLEHQSLSQTACNVTRKAKR
jgi:hypothetical protein